MKKNKAVAFMLVVTMLAGVFSGCSKTTKVTGSKFETACSKLSLEEIEFDYHDVPYIGSIEEGCFMSADEDQLEELAENEGRQIEKMLRQFDIFEFIDIDDIRSLAVAARCDGLEDLYELEAFEDIAGIELDGALAFQMTLGEDGHAEEFMDSVKELLSIADIRTKNLSSDEFFSSGNEGYCRLHIDTKDLIEVILNDEDIVDHVSGILDGDLEDVIGDITGDIAISLEINGADVFAIAGISVNKKAEVYYEFAKAFGIASDPMRLPKNEKLIQDIADIMSGAFSNMAEALYAASNRRTDSIDPKDGDDDGDPVNYDVGISMPTKDLIRWTNDGYLMKNDLEEDGYRVDLRFADNDTNTQIAQIDEMIESGIKVLIVAAIAPDSLGEVLQRAHNKSITVIAYDRFPVQTRAVDYYVTFDQYMVGTLQGEYIAASLDLENSDGPFNMEITSGDINDMFAPFFYQGAYDVLSPYIESGKLVVVSGQMSFEKTATDSWSTDKARGRAEYTLGMNYIMTGLNVDAWLCANDSTALGVITAVESTDYEGTYPVITGQDCEIENVKNIISGKQAMSVFKDTRDLAAQTAKMAKQVLMGEPVDVNDTSTYNNGVKTVNAYLCAPVVVVKDNYKDILIDSGYYTESDLV